MGFSAFFDDVATICAEVCGDAVTFIDATDSSETACYCVLQRQSEPVLIAGDVTIDEDHYTGQIPQVSLSVTPVIGDTIKESDATTYRIDEPPQLSDGMWVLTLRKL